MISPESGSRRVRPKHLWLGLLILVCGVGLGHTAYVKIKTCSSSVGCTMSWLRTQLKLTPAQYARLEVLHQEHGAALKRLRDTAPDKAACQESCRLETQAFIERVCAELTPEQQTRYRELVAPCTREKSQEP